MKIVNVRGLKANTPGITYCGRSFAGWTGSVLGNPFKVGRDGTLDEVITQYEMWLAGQIILSAGEPQRAALRELTEDSVLGCWCAPKRCHCEVIEKLWKRFVNA